MTGAGLVIFFLRLWIGRIAADVEHVKKVQEKTADDVMHLRIEFKDCVTWDEFHREVDPIKDRLNEQDRRFSGHVAACQERHKGGK
jgi:hypothetical protein